MITNSLIKSEIGRYLSESDKYLYTAYFYSDEENTDSYYTTLIDAISAALYEVEGAPNAIYISIYERGNLLDSSVKFIETAELTKDDYLTILD